MFSGLPNISDKSEVNLNAQKENNWEFSLRERQLSCLKLLKGEEVGFDLQNDMKSTIIVIIWSHD